MSPPLPTHKHAKQRCKRDVPPCAFAPSQHVKAGKACISRGAPGPPRRLEIPRLAAAKCPSGSLEGPHKSSAPAAGLVSFVSCPALETQSYSVVAEKCGEASAIHQYVEIVLGAIHPQPDARRTGLEAEARAGPIEGNSASREGRESERERRERERKRESERERERERESERETESERVSAQSRNKEGGLLIRSSPTVSIY